MTDCEGPLTRNDNAMEVAAAFVPDGAELFARLSRYDDFLADVLHKPGYNAGDTLRLIVPFLLAYGVGDRDVEEYSADTVLVVPGARDLLRDVAAALPSYIISTSYTPYIRALCRVVDFPFAHCRCTSIDLDAWHLTRDEADWLRDRAEAILEQPVIELPEAARSAADLSAADRAAVAELDRLFWTEMGAQGRRSADIVAAVRPIGGGLKLAALREIAAGRRVELCATSCTWATRSPTCRPSTRCARPAAWRSASTATATRWPRPSSPPRRPTRRPPASWRWPSPPAAAKAVLDAIRAWPPTSKPLPRVGLLAEAGAALSHASAYARSHVRGERVARLG